MVVLVKLPEGARVCVNEKSGDRHFIVAEWDRGHRTEFVSWRVTAGGVEFGRYFDNFLEALDAHDKRVLGLA